MRLENLLAGLVVGLALGVLYTNVCGLFLDMVFNAPIGLPFGVASGLVEGLYVFLRLETS